MFGVRIKFRKQRSAKPLQILEARCWDSTQDSKSPTKAKTEGAFIEDSNSSDDEFGLYLYLRAWTPTLLLFYLHTLSVLRAHIIQYPPNILRHP